MSTEMYPLSIGTLRVSPANRVITDEMESGVTYARSLWESQTFRRTFALSHPALTRQELRYLQDFHAARNGRADTFYFRDNVNREGNHTVRFASAPTWGGYGDARQVDLTLMESAPRRCLPTKGELAAILGPEQFVMWDANRELALTHVDALTHDPDGLWDTWSGGHVGLWQAGGIGFGASLAEDYQHFRADGTCWAKTTELANLVGGKPGFTLFALVRHSTCSAKQVILSIGSVGTGGALGLVLTADNRYEPWVGGTETWSTARQHNSPAGVWRSIAVVWAEFSNNATLYVDAVAVATEAVSRSFSNGPETLFASSSGSLKSGSGLAQADVANAMFVQKACTGAQVKSLHNLLGYQFGLAQVA